MTDWNELRVRYIAGKMSLKQLAEENDVSYSQVMQHSSREKWTQQRKIFGRNAAEKTLARASARAQANLEKAILVTEGLLDVSVKALEDRDQFRRYLVVRKDGRTEETTEEVFRKVDTKAIKELTEAVEKMTALLRQLLGEPEAGEKQKRETEKLRQEKLKEEIKQLKDESGKTGQPADMRYAVRLETEEEYRARTGDTETEQEAEDLPG